MMILSSPVKTKVSQIYEIRCITVSITQQLPCFMKKPESSCLFAINIPLSFVLEPNQTHPWSHQPCGHPEPEGRDGAKAALKAPLGSAAVRQEGTVPQGQFSCSKELPCWEKGLQGLRPAPRWLQAGLLGFWVSSFPPSLQPPGSAEAVLPAGAVVPAGSGKQ